MQTTQIVQLHVRAQLQLSDQPKQLSETITVKHLTSEQMSVYSSEHSDHLFAHLMPILDDNMGNLVSRQNPVSQNRPYLICMALLMATMICCCQHCFGQKRVNLSTATPESGIHRVQVNLTVRGTIEITSGTAPHETLPLNVVADLLYDEKCLPTKLSLRTIRHYHAAKADIEVGQAKVEPSLQREHRNIVFDQSGDDLALYSPQGPMTRDELDLIDVQANSALVHQLLPKSSKATGESWNATPESLAAILNLEAVNRSDVQCKLSKLEGELAVIDLSGSVTGAIDGVSTEIELKAQINFHRKHRRIVGLAIALKEHRESGQSQPGVDVIAQLRMAIHPITTSPHLSNDVIADLNRKRTPESTLLMHRSSSGYRLLHNRNWHVIAEEPELTVLRCVEQGDRLAHCNITKLTKLPRGERISLQTFAADIERSLGASFGQIVEATQATRDNDYHIMRVVATGQAAEIPIQWLFFHITSPTGHRASIAFTMESAMAERFGNAGSTLVSSFEFVGNQAANKGQAPSAATTRSASKTTNGKSAR